MRKKIRGFGAICLVLSMLMSLSLTAFAEEADLTQPGQEITVTNPEDVADPTQSETTSNTAANTTDSANDNTVGTTDPTQDGTYTEVETKSPAESNSNPDGTPETNEISTFSMDNGVQPTNTGLEGEGTEASPYFIHNAAELQQLDQKDQYIYAVLTNDINLSETDVLHNVDDWFTSYLLNFHGELDGAGYEIRGAANFTQLIGNFRGGVLKNLTWQVEDRCALVGWQRAIEEEKGATYENITIKGELNWTSDHCNESALVTYAQGQTTMRGVTLDLNMTSPTYNGLFVGYGLYQNSSFVFENCVVKGNYYASYLGVLFGNGSYNLHTGATDGLHLATADNVKIINMDMSGATLRASSEANVLGGIGCTKAIDEHENIKSLEATLRNNVTGLNIVLTNPLNNYTFTLNNAGLLKIAVGEGASSVDHFGVISELYSTVWFNNKDIGSQKHSAVEEIQIQKDGGINTYYSNLGKVSFYDGGAGDGTFGTTGNNGKTRTITVDGTTYYALLPDGEGYTFTFGGTNAVHTKTTRTSTVKVVAYDQNNQILHIFDDIKKDSSDFSKPSITATGTAYAGRSLQTNNLTLSDGWTFVDPNTVVVLGGQTVFAKKGTEVAPVEIKGEAIVADSVSLDKQTLAVKAGKSEKLTATVSPSDTADQTLTWTSSNEKAAVVEPDGTVYGVAAGKATITVKTANGKSATCEVTVSEIAINSPDPIDPIKPVNKVTTVPDTSNPEAMQEMLANSIPKDSELGQAVAEAEKDGVLVQFVFEVTPKDKKDMTEEEKAEAKKVEDYIKEQGNADGKELHQYLDLSIFVVAGEKELGKLTKTNEPITYKLKLPDNLDTEGKTLFIVKVHNGEVSRIELTLREDGLYEFTTNEFSLYALASEVNTYNIQATANPAEGGTITGAGTYEYGKSAELKAEAKSGYTFSRWTENGMEVSKDAKFTVKDIQADHTYVAEFTKNQDPVPAKTFTIKATANPAEGGSVTGAGTYEAGKSAELKAEAKSGYTFSKWTENGTEVSKDAKFTVTDIQADHTYVAEFTKNQAQKPKDQPKNNTKSAVKTGDTTPIVGLIILLALSGLAVGIVLIKRKRA